MAQLVGYGIGATGPLLAGGLYGATGGWGVPLATLAGIAVCYAGVAAVAGRPVTIGGPATGDPTTRRDVPGAHADASADASADAVVPGCRDEGDLERGGHGRAGR
jgi:hypothetical protein